MKTLYELCKPRAEVFSGNHDDDVLDLVDLAEEKIDVDDFFKTNYVTDGMKHLVDMAFMRFSGKGGKGLIRLRQSMGGGKTHNMISLGLLARHPMARKYLPKELTHGFTKTIKVVSYTGRDSDIKYGIWGEIARQLNKFESFREYYSPLRAPGQSAWINLLQGKDPILILLDELPPYLTYIRTQPVGTGTLADVTQTALANLFSAVSKEELSNVCIVVSDLKATYELGSEILTKSFKDLDGEITRTAEDIEPVRANSDDLYHILRKKLFETLPEKNEVVEVAKAFKDEVNKANQMNITGIDALKIYEGIVEVYPFHPCIKDLFARFKENINFQQTRGFIRLTRCMIRCLYDENKDVVPAKSKYIINAFDYDLNDNITFSTVKNIKPKLENAISHDVCSSGRAVAEIIDGKNSTDMQEMAKIILMASLGDVTNVVLGLTPSEIVGNMIAPGRNLSNLAKQFKEQFCEKAWYVYSDKDSKIFFQNVQNVNARIVSIVDSFSNEQAKNEIKSILQKRFAPKSKDCYQKLYVFPAVDEIELNRDQVSLVLFEPNPKDDLPEDLKVFFGQCQYPNRVMFLSGSRDTMNSLLENAKKSKAINTILAEFKRDNIPEQDTQYQAALQAEISCFMSISSAMNETFVKLYYPIRSKESELKSAYTFKNITMEFQNNKFDVEELIRQTLIGVSKFSTPSQTSEDTFRKKIERRLFTSKVMRWTDIVQRAATYTLWNWYHPSTLEDVKNYCISNGLWIQDGDMINKEPPPPVTGLSVRRVSDDFDKGTVTLKLLPDNGDRVHYEIGQPATMASMVVKDIDAFETDEMVLYFLCEDSTGKYQPGECVKWENSVRVRNRFFDKNNAKYCELVASNKKVKIKYSTDGSEPREGAVYNEPFIVQGGGILQAIAYYEPADLYGELLKDNIPYYEKPADNGSSDNGDTPAKPQLVIDESKPLRLVRINKMFNNNTDIHNLIQDMKKINLKVIIGSLTVADINNTDIFVDITTGGNVWDADVLDNMIKYIRNSVLNNYDTNVKLKVKEFQFGSGKDFKRWVGDNKAEIESFENFIKQ
ncbi:DUF499 domain-containing protein [Phascolarctobacterium sp.]|uniref:DUF499 domain-containing protein n=1 Tax=Phascolarctobacterium sp. TaxID=2049039 RepID=UPI002A83B4C0|nr:DUF499 domain-containing protein [Phascolarctobacterium sp.]MDY5044974.1 DUF499 domain-containing protein [Phascolarctobacterium sp.]